NSMKKLSSKGSKLLENQHLNSTQRSSDWALGTDANKLQVWLLLRLMAQITGKNAMVAYHRNVNCHIYDNQMPLVPTQLEREMLEEPTLDINPDIRTLEDLETWVSLDDFKITIPKTHPAIAYPFSV
ncbi:MAG: thymidylate synthase, partial [Pseudomonadota bacterium]